MNPVSPSAPAVRMLAPHTVRAHNFAAQSPNKIHDNDVAAKLGFTGGLVPGVALYAYMTVPMARDFGVDWIARGAKRLRLLADVLDPKFGESLEILADGPFIDPEYRGNDRVWLAGEMPPFHLIQPSENHRIAAPTALLACHNSGP